MDPSKALLTDKVAIITGGGDGIGKGIALAFACFGAHIVIADRNGPSGERAAAEVRALAARRWPSRPTSVTSTRSRP